MIGITGATGHLGSVLAGMLPDAVPIGRIMPEYPVDALIHCAAPDYRNDTAVTGFMDYIEALRLYVQRNEISNVIVVGSWWQHSEGNAGTLRYTQMKDQQTRLFGNNTHVIPYSIYGNEARPGRGFIPQLIQTINGGPALKGLSTEPRDFIHVTDVAQACIAALTAPRGTYLAATRIPRSPRQIATQYRVTAPDYVEHPSAVPTYKFPDVPGWKPQINVHDHIRASVPDQASHPT